MSLQVAFLGIMFLINAGNQAADIEHQAESRLGFKLPACSATPSPQ